MAERYRDIRERWREGNYLSELHHLGVSIGRCGAVFASNFETALHQIRKSTEPKPKQNFRFGFGFNRRADGFTGGRKGRKKKKERSQGDGFSLLITQL